MGLNGTYSNNFLLRVSGLCLNYYIYLVGSTLQRTPVHRSGGERTNYVPFMILAQDYPCTHLLYHLSSLSGMPSFLNTRFALLWETWKRSGARSLTVYKEKMLPHNDGSHNVCVTKQSFMLRCIPKQIMGIQYLFFVPFILHYKTNIFRSIRTKHDKS